MSRFATLPNNPSGRFANLSERLRAPLPGEAANTSPRSTVSSRLAALRADDQAKRTSALRAPSPAAKSAPPKPAKADPKALVAAAEKKGVLEAQARHDAVMASDAAKGRERQAHELLLASCDRTAKLKSSTDIIAELAKRPTDASATWDQVIAKHNARLTAVNPNCRSAADEKPKMPEPTGDVIADSWARAIARMNGVFS